jgi:hypothetical protein
MITSGSKQRSHKTPPFPKREAFSKQPPVGRPTRRNPLDAVSERPRSAAFLLLYQLLQDTQLRKDALPVIWLSRDLATPPDP